MNPVQAPQFVFVHVSPALPAWTIDGQPIGIQHNIKETAFRGLATKLDNDGACTIYADVTGSAGYPISFNSKNTFRDLHAEENLIVNVNQRFPKHYKQDVNEVWWCDVPIDGMLISLEPCHKELPGNKIRYVGHQCIDLFKAGGRAFETSKDRGGQYRGRFSPSQPYTFVFFIEKQTAKGERSVDWAALKRGNTVFEFKTLMDNLFGPPQGTQLYQLGSSFAVGTKMTVGANPNANLVMPNAEVRNYAA